MFIFFWKIRTCNFEAIVQGNLQKKETTENQRRRRGPPLSTLWSEEEVEKLKNMAAAGIPKNLIAEELGRTERSISIKTCRLGIQINREGRLWTKQEEQEFASDWADGSLSKYKLCKKYNRTWHALSKRAVSMHLGSRPANEEFLTPKMICEEMQVSDDRVYNWISLGLKTKKNRSGRVKYLIDQKDLLSFLESHPKMYNANKISPYLFVKEPDWLKEKRKKDREKFASSNRLEYTNEEDKQIVNLFSMGKSDKEIAEALSRNEIGLAAHRRVLGLMRREYAELELTKH